MQESIYTVHKQGIICTECQLQAVFLEASNCVPDKVNIGIQ